jgi:hypothetical protein
MRVFVYWNVHKCRFSIKALDGLAKGRVVAHADEVLIRDAEFRVNQKGRERVRATGRKEVHARIVGHLEAWKGDATGAHPNAYWTGCDSSYARFARTDGHPVTYNPYRDTAFRYVEPTLSAAAPATVDMVYAYVDTQCSVSTSFRPKRRIALLAFSPLMMPEA